MRGRGNRLLTGVTVFCCAPICSGLAAGEMAANSEARSLAATCAACHGTDGHAVAGPAMLRLAGMPKAEFVRQMRDFRGGTRDATVMQQIAKGYDDAQIDALGAFFAAQR